VAGGRAYSTRRRAAKAAIFRLFRPPARGWKKRASIKGHEQQNLTGGIDSD